MLSVGLFALAFVSIAPALAQSTDGIAFTSFSSEIWVHPDSTFTVLETIQGVFETPHHGIFRDIPVRYANENGQPMSVRIAVESAFLGRTSTPFQVSRRGDFLEVKLGRSDETVIGPFTYTIEYRVSRALLFHDADGEAEVFWTVTDPQDVFFPTSVASVKVDGVASAEDLRGACFTGAFGSTEQNCRITTDGDRLRFSAEDYLTIAARFPKSLVREPSAAVRKWWWLEDNWPALFLLLPIISLIAALWLWWKKGRDPKGTGVIVAQYEPPDRLPPIVVGVLWREAIHGHDFSATIVDLAVRGFLKIKEEGKADYRFIQGKPAEAAMPEFEKKILDALFQAGNDVTLKDRATALGTAKEKTENGVYTNVVSNGYFVRNPKVVRSRYFTAGFTLALGGFFGLMAAPFQGLMSLFFGLILSSLPFFFIANAMPRRTAKGVAAREYAAGFKLFLSTAERYRLQWQEKEGIFEQYLPYAMVFEIVEKWTKAFENITVPPPTWYEGAQPFSAVMFGRQMARFGMYTAMMAKPPAPRGVGHSVSSRGGFGGGGFSGGGFGGGRTGGW